MSDIGTGAVLLIRAVDAGATYISFRWLDDPTHPIVHAITKPEMSRLGARLDSALVEPATGEGDRSRQAVQQALSGPFTRYLSEYALTEALTRAIMPAAVLDAIRARAERGRITVRVTPSRALSRMPFELFVVDHPRRLVELADIAYEPPAAIHLGRARKPETWTDDVARRPVLYAVDPRLPAGSGLGALLVDPARAGTAPSNTGAFLRRIADRPHTHHSGVQKIVGRWELSEDLRGRPSRLFYFGHVSATTDQPGSASLHLYDDNQEWGLAAPLNNAHLPLSALDLLLGTATPELGPDGIDPVESAQAGHELWPMPPRVAVIACEGGVDYRSSETFGLVMAIFGAGAEILTTTRWILPSDTAFGELAGVDAIPGPTTELALAVDDTHTAADPAAALSAWQRTRLRHWQDDPGPATSPLTWSGVVTHVCPHREVVASPRAEETS
ncbi:CHAT domain-containing protein [Gordonia sp. NPDC003376]